MHLNLSAQIAKQFSDVHFGGNWTAVNLKETLADVNWQQAMTKVYSLNTIAALVFHNNYYVSGLLEVLRGQPLAIKDIYSYDLPPIQSEGEWEHLLNKTWKDAEAFAQLVEQLPEERLWLNFADPKYGTYYRNLHGLIEHTHYHLGQIVLIKKILLQSNS